jgi:hypothetical protein
LVGRQRDPAHYHANLLKVLKRHDKRPCSFAERESLIETLKQVKTFLLAHRRKNLAGPWPV